MSYKILEQNGIDNENIDSGAFNNFAAGNRDGVLKGVLEECNLVAEGNSISIGTGVIILQGIRVKITDPEIISVSSVPSEPVRYQIVAQLVMEEGDLSCSFFVRIPTELIKDNFYNSGKGNGIYQQELGRVTHGTNGDLTDIQRTLDIISGGGGTSTHSVEIGNVSTNMIDAGLPAEVDVDSRVEGEKVVIDFNFSFPESRANTIYTVKNLTVKETNNRQFLSDVFLPEGEIENSDTVCLQGLDISSLSPELQNYVNSIEDSGIIYLNRVSPKAFFAVLGAVARPDLCEVNNSGAFSLYLVGNEYGQYQLFGTVISDQSGSAVSAVFDNAGNPLVYKYVKPDTGIPKSDLESSVQTSLSKADSALQSIPVATSSALGGVKPTTKTSEMTQSVGVDSNGALWTKEASEGTTVVANPTATGTQDLNSLQVGGTVYNIPQGTGSDEPIIPTIGENGNWYVNGVDTGKPSRGATGTAGADGLPALVQTRSLSAQNITSPMAIPNEVLNRAANAGEGIVLFAKQQSDNKSYLIVGTVQSVGTSNPYTFIEFSEKTVITGEDGQDGAAGADGKDGATPEIGENGNWFINGEDTGKPSRGEAAASNEGGIVAVDVLPDPSEVEYEKHLLYLKDTDLNYIVAKPSDEANVTIVSSLPYKLSSHNGAVSIGDCAYIFGTNNGTEYTKDIIKFDSVSKECTVLSCKMPKLIYYAMCASVGKNAYIFGGYDGTTVSYNIIKFDSETETFTTLSATTLQAKMQGAVFTIGNNIYIVAGRYSGSKGTLKAVRFDTESETSTYIASTEEYLYYPIACSVGENGYIFGSEIGAQSDSIEKYDSVANTFTILPSELPENVAHGGIGRIGTNIYILGGGSSTNDSIIKFDSETETCTTLSVTLPSGRSYLHACNIGSDIYTFGGITAGSARTDEVLKFGFGYSYSYKKITATEV